jgi:hypothetical protein
VLTSSRARFTGELGTVERLKIAPLPGVDIEDVPMAFVAVILAKILVPSGRVNGDCIKTLTGMLQLLAVTIVPIVPSQFERSCE